MQLYFYNGQSTNYGITTDGQLFNLKTEKWLKGQINKSGYKTFYITLEDGIKKRLYAHRMVMTTFNPVENMDKLEVNHIDGNKQNNNIFNLEWVNSKENKQHAIKNGLYDNNRKKVYCFDKEKNLIAEFNTITDAASICKVSWSGLSSVLNKDDAPLFNGCYWRFTPNSDFNIFIPINNGRKKKVAQFDLNGHFISEYDSVAEAAKKNEIIRTNISKCCNGYIKTYKGFVWKFI